jgi:diadenosine tetraphosphate (Ap4A) HIT family hydrolase
MCPFCKKAEEEMILQNDLVFAVYDGYPVNVGHVLICTRRHTPTYFDATREEKLAIIDAVDAVKELLDRRYHPDGYNVGVNCGRAAGQSIEHLHVHVIPRYAGDMEQPKGGVRGVIPAKQGY